MKRQKNQAEKLCYKCARRYLPNAYKDAKRWEIRLWFKRIDDLGYGLKWCPGYPHDPVRGDLVPVDCFYPLEQIVLRQQK